ncbi:MAG TPA: SpoIIE family protein phosphatase, partial [Marmoricola sp.]|nr:SpoIIE family protein phosphatase [Marmoricola sp.]
MLLPDAPAWAADLAHLDALEEAAFAADPEGVIRYANPVSLRLQARLDVDPATGLPGAVRLHDLVPEHLRGGFDEVLGQALEGTTWAGRLDVLSADGMPRETDVTCSPLRQRGRVVGVLLLVDDPTEPQAGARDARRLDDRLTRLARVAAELGAAVDVTTVTDVVIGHLCDAVGATVASLNLLEGEDTLVLAGLRGGSDGAAQRWTSYPVSEPTPAGDVTRTGEPLFLIGRDAIDAAYPDLERAAEGERSMVALPLRLTGRTLGAVTLSFPGKRSLDAAELEFFAILADSCTQALERIRAQDEARTQAARMSFLATASAELAASLDYEMTLANVARLAVPEFADWSAVDLLEDDRMHRLAVDHIDPAKVQFALEIERRYPSDKDSSPAWRAVRSGESILVDQVTDEMLVEGTRDEEHLRLARELGLRSALMVPLVTHDRVLGAITWVMAESGRHYSEDDVKFAEDLARRAAMAIDNAQLHSQTRVAAEQLQHAVLPELPVGVPEWQLASFYSPAGRTEVGGDFYDAVPLAGGRLAVFIGDVMGRGVQAAAAMAQMRSALRAFIAVDPAPETVLTKLDLLFTTYDMSQLVTLVYLVLSPTSVSYVNAGHPPPVVLAADGHTSALEFADGPPLGAHHHGVRRAHTTPFGPGDTLLAFTDGLVERREEDIDDGLRRLRETLPGLGEGALGVVLPRLVDEVRDHSR